MHRIDALVELEIGQGCAPGVSSWLNHPPRDLVGLALSGGGIRSATFNLGVLQKLHDLQLLHIFDYLSTVSGGGYIGGFWTRWRARQPAESRKDFPDVAPHLPEPIEVRHLRQFSNFLSPRMGLTVDTGRMLIAGLSSALPSILAALALIVLALGAWLGIAGLLFDTSKLLPWAVGPWAEGPDIRTLLALTVVTVLFLIASEVRWRRQTSDSVAGRAYLFAGAVGTLVTTVAWVVLRTHWGPLENPYAPGQLLPIPADDQATLEWLYLLAPTLAWGAGVLGLVLLRWWYSRWVRGLHWRIIRAAHDRVQMRLLLLASGWAALSAIWILGVVLHAWVTGVSALPRATGVGGAILLAAALFARLQKLLGRAARRGGASTVLSRLRPVLPRVLAYVTVALVVTSVVAVITAVAAAGGPSTRLVRLAAVLLGAAVAILSVLLFLDPNEVALHPFYKSRLTRAYLGASNPATQPAVDERGQPDPRHKPRTEEHDDDDIRLSDLQRVQQPIHLICCAANDQADSAEMDDLRRGASSAVLSPVGLSVGADGAWAPWSHANPAIMLGTALTASAAAFNPLMGSYSVKLGPAVTFLAAALNLRLGIWQRHPTLMRERDLAAANEADTIRARLERPRRKPLLIGAPFFREMFGMARAEGPFVHLSDGGHFENMGVYELVRRHCRVIVACDCGADPGCTFNDVAKLVRRVRQDFGIEIQIDLDPLRPGEGGLSASAVTLGRILYPGDERPGVLVLIKPSLVGNEPADIRHYKSQCADFPHETTTDQFYDEEQWESYHRLGQHSAAAALQAIREKTAPAAAPAGELLFATLDECLMGRSRNREKVHVAGVQPAEGV